jgi:hypothetical protein
MGSRDREVRRKSDRAVSTEPQAAPAVSDAPPAPSGPGDPAAPSTSPFWLRRRSLIIALAVLVIAVITVLTDLPVPTSRASDISAERAVMSEVNTDVAACALGLHEAIGIWNLEASHQLPASGRASAPGLLNDDQVACSFTNEGINDLTTNLQTPGTAAGKDLGELVATATLWTTSDALRMIEDVQTLMDHPHNGAKLRDLVKEQSQLAADRRTALAQEHAAETALDTQLQPVHLPAMASVLTG